MMSLSILLQKILLIVPVGIEILLCGDSTDSDSLLIVPVGIEILIVNISILQLMAFNRTSRN